MLSDKNVLSSAGLTSAIARRQMSTPLLLMLAGHRPLTFVTGQMLYLFAPCAAILGWEGITEWAALLSAPDANQRLTAMLTTLPLTVAKSEPAESELG
jgi:hypothetical protein